MNLTKISSAEDEWAQGYILNDEWANWLTHGGAFVLSLIGLIALLNVHWHHTDFLASYVVYAFTLSLMYGASTLYHYIKHPVHKKWLRLADHCAIYLFIAGSYTPFTLILMEEGGIVLLTTIWAMALVGIFFKIVFRHKYKVLSLLFYLTMGWLVIFSAETLFSRLHPHGIYGLVAGGALLHSWGRLLLLG